MRTTLITTNYQVTLNDFKILCNQTAPITITLPKSPILGTSFIITDITGQASTNNITIVASTGLQINGSPSYILNSDYSQVKIIYDDVNLDLTLSSGSGGGANINDGTSEGSTIYLDNSGGVLTENLYVTYNSSDNYMGFNTGMILKLAHITTNYAPFSYDYGMIVDSTLSPITITLPGAPNDGQVYFVKDAMGTSPINIITVNGNGYNIDGSASFVINLPYESYTMIFNSSTNQLSLI